MSKVKRTKKSHSSKVKFQIILEVVKKELSQAEISRNYGVNANLISRWKNDFFENGYKMFEIKKNSTDELKKKNKEIEELENIIGKQTVEIALLKKFLGHYRSD